MTTMSEASDSVAVATEILRQWEEEQRDPNFNPLQILTKLAEIVEAEICNYLKMDPDPFDDRHPSRTDPNCTLGQLLKALFKKDPLMNKLVDDYTRDSSWPRLSPQEIKEINIASCRLLLDVMPGVETSVVFQDSEMLIMRLFSWAQNASDPLCSYAVGVLAAAMEVQDIATNFREQNSILVPIMLKKLKILQQEYFQEDCSVPEEVFTRSDDVVLKAVVNGKTECSVNQSLNENSLLNDCSNSSWAEMGSYMIGTFQMYPLTLAMKQTLILKYLTPVGEYQDLLGYVFEYDALSIILKYINFSKNHDVRLGFEALKYLSSLLCHKKISLEFINFSGLERLLEVPRPSIAATGVSMCLYYLACSEEAMEKISQLSKFVISDLVKYGLWLLECSHESGRCHATMFFGLCFRFKVILEKFDQQDGLRKLFNVVSTLYILSVEDHSLPFLNDDQEFASRQTVRHVCVALRKYFEVHLVILSEQLQRTHYREQGCTNGYISCCNKLANYSSDVILENVQLVQMLLPIRKRCDPVSAFLKLNGVHLLLRVIGMAYDWNYSGRADTVKNALDVLCICSIMSEVQEAFCEKVNLPDDDTSVGISILLGASEGEVVTDPDVQKSALNVIIACVCAPSKVNSVGLGHFNSAGFITRKANAVKAGDELLCKMWDCVRGNNGIMVLLNLLLVKFPLTDADNIRSLSCRALVGLARSETVRQIMSKLPLFTNGQLQILMREPILQEKRQEHVNFCKYALELLELVSGKKKYPGSEFEVSLSNIHKADVVAQTRITFNERQLLQLIHTYLFNKGYSDSAITLQREANLPTSTKITPVSGFPPLKLNSSPGGLPRIARTPLTPGSRTGVFNSAVTHSPRILSLNSSQNSNSSPMRGLNARSNGSRQRNEFVRPIQKQISGGEFSLSPLTKVNPNQCSSEGQVVSLENIVTEYLMNQHALCKNPMVTCPQFDLFSPHRCPDPKSKKSAPLNVTSRISQRSIFPVHGGYDGAKFTRKLIYSRYKPVMTYRCALDSSYFTTCCFSACEQFMMAGTLTGDLKLFNVPTGSEEATYQCHESAITSLLPSRDGNLLLTSSVWRRPLSSLWTLGEFFDLKLVFPGEEYVEFSNLVQDKVLATHVEVANVYDIHTGQLIVSLIPQSSNQYNKNRAIFNPTDDLVLCDGVLWDYHNRKAIHKFDKFNQILNGVFHPNGLEIISNTEVWDLRTFHLLHTVPSLDHSLIKFSNSGDVFFGHTVDLEIEGSSGTGFESSFRSFDSSDYSNITTVDVKKCIYEMCINKKDTHVAVVENSDNDDGIVDESWIRVYEVGRNRDIEDEAEQEEEDDDVAGSDGSDISATENDNITDELIDLLDPGSGDEVDRSQGGEDNQMITDNSISSDTSVSFLSNLELDSTSADSANDDNDSDEDEDDGLYSLIQ